MITIRYDTAQDIRDGLRKIKQNYLPRRRRVRWLEAANRRLLALRRTGHDIETSLVLDLKRTLARERQRLDRQSNDGLDVVDCSVYDLKPGQVTKPSSKRYKGLLVGEDEDGAYVTNGEERSDSYSWCGAIPEDVIDDLADQD